MIDGSELPIEENIAITKKVVAAAHACGVSVEAEIGHVGGRGDDAVKEDVYTTVEESKNILRADRCGYALQFLLERHMVFI